MMNRSLPFVIVAVLIAAGVVLSLSVGAGGGSEAIVSQGQEPTEISDEERERLVEEADQLALASLEEMVKADIDPCSVPLDDFLGSASLLYQDIPTLVNDVDSIVYGDIIRKRMVSPRQGTVASRVLADLSVREAILGVPGPTITFDAGNRIMQGEGGPVRFNVIGLDICSTDSVLLFLKLTPEDGVFAVASFVSITDGATDEENTSRLFSAPDVATDPLTEVRQIVADQAADGLVKGRLVCDARKAPQDFVGAPACPGETFNPFADFGFARILEAFVVTQTHGQLGVAEQVDVAPDSEALAQLLNLLNTDFGITSSSFIPTDVFRIGITTTTTGTRPYSMQLLYSPGAGVIQMLGVNGQIAAPEGFGSALDALLQGS